MTCSWQSTNIPATKLAVKTDQWLYLCTRTQTHLRTHTNTSAHPPPHTQNETLMWSVESLLKPMSLGQMNGQSTTWASLCVCVCVRALVSMHKCRQAWGWHQVIFLNPSLFLRQVLSRTLERSGWARLACLEPPGTLLLLPPSAVTAGACHHAGVSKGTLGTQIQVPMLSQALFFFL